MNNIDIDHELWYCHEQHWYLPWKTLIFTTHIVILMNNIDICTMNKIDLPWTVLTFAMNTPMFITGDAKIEFLKQPTNFSVKFGKLASFL